ncbi:hypothetical protein Tsubulata_044746 [Turnera subulata]|uniref:DUF4283 domain-containing protein n=1 Tax=Turnera subulata TaxID=218843 RepID=A0A9Q0G041_9ROSI|nr:hypothetical protein Tsubulata_044746 [Turnera subulata]
MDVYIPMKRTNKGMKFCFVRFKGGIKDIQRLLSDINRVYVESGSIRANVARERKQSRQPPQINRHIPSSWEGVRVSDRKTYGATVQGNQPNENPISNQPITTNLTYIPTSGSVEWLSRCAVGILKKPERIDSAHYVWALHGYGEVQVSDLGGDSILACFPTKSSTDQFFHKTPDWIRLWFTSFKTWKKGDRVENRRCWLTVGGVPLNAWCTEFFSLIASFFGQMVRIARDTDQRRCLDAASVEVLTT